MANSKTQSTKEKQADNVDNKASTSAGSGNMFTAEDVNTIVQQAVTSALQATNDGNGNNGNRSNVRDRFQQRRQQVKQKAPKASAEMIEFMGVDCGGLLVTPRYYNSQKPESRNYVGIKVNGNLSQYGGSPQARPISFKAAIAYEIAHQIKSELEETNGTELRWPEHRPLDKFESEQPHGIIEVILASYADNMVNG